MDEPLDLSQNQNNTTEEDVQVSKIKTHIKTLFLSIVKNGNKNNVKTIHYFSPQHLGSKKNKLN